MNRELARAVRDRAQERCEYCRIPQFALPLPFQIDHIIAEQHGGETALDNLAFACPHCNRYKGPNIAGLDPVSGELVRLFHPRTDIWVGHLQIDAARIAGTTAIGRRRFCCHLSQCWRWRNKAAPLIGGAIST